MGDRRSYAAAVARRPFPALLSADSPSPPKPTSISAQVEGSGTAEPIGEVESPWKEKFPLVLGTPSMMEG